MFVYLTNNMGSYSFQHLRDAHNKNEYILKYIYINGLWKIDIYAIMYSKRK